MNEVVVIHKNSEGILCWGGPEHNKVAILSDDKYPGQKYLFPVKRKLTYKAFEAGAIYDELHSRIPTVAYRIIQWYALWGPYNAEVWPILVYAQHEERLLQNFELTVNFIRMLHEL